VVPSEEGSVPERIWVAASDRGEEGAFKWCYPDRVDSFQFPPFVSFSDGEPSNTDDVGKLFGNRSSIWQFVLQ